jgi:hypothetical protein
MSTAQPAHKYKPEATATAIEVNGFILSVAKIGNKLFQVMTYIAA